MFIEPKISDIKLSKILNVDNVELHTGKFCNLFNKKKNTKDEFKRIYNAARHATKLDLEVHAGHGLTFSSAKQIAKIKTITEFNIGHFIISESIFLGLEKTIKKFKRIINK